MPHVTPYNQAMADVRACVRSSKTSFAIGMALLPLPRRESMYALYAFCRTVDDIADDSLTPEERDEGLQLWHQRISNLFEKEETSDSITTALFPLIERYNVREKDFQDIINGMEMDAAKPIRAPQIDDLDTYCNLVASAVGRISVRIFGDPSDEAQKVAYHLGRALQLTNILRDLAEDAARDRLYLPKELLEKHDILTHVPTEVIEHPDLTAVCRDLADIAVQHFKQADKWIKKCRHGNMRPARSMRYYYYALLKKLRAADWQDPYKRVSLSFWEKSFIALRSLVS